MTRIEKQFERLKARKEKGFIAFITAGDPTLRDTVDIAWKLEDAGADIVELGVPFSDPLADGRVNQEAAARALAQGANLDRIMEVVQAIRKKSEIPLIFFSYINPLIARGFERTVRESAEAGIDGFIILDLPVEESGLQRRILAKHHLNNICLITPTSPDERIRRIAGATTGFVYCVSREGVTGMQKRLAPAAVKLVRRTKQFTRLPVALGFGIAAPAQARAAAAVADAVIVGSAVVDHFHRQSKKEAARWVASMVRAVKRG